MERYCYAIIDENGACWRIVDGGTERVSGLPSLIREGWKPIRETPYMSDRKLSLFILICLELESG